MHACYLKKKKKKKKKKKQRSTRQSWIEDRGRWGLMTGFSFEANCRSGEVTLYYMYDWALTFVLKCASLLCLLEYAFFACIFSRHEIGSLWRGAITWLIHMCFFVNYESLGRIRDWQFCQIPFFGQYDCSVWLDLTIWHIHLSMVLKWLKNWK